MNRTRVLVCGTNYGRTYLDAIRLGAKSYCLAGILGRGSVRSEDIAREYRVPLYRNVEHLDTHVDLACAAMGASGANVVLGLLRRRIHILCEHPQRQDCLKSALDVAASLNLCFHVNGHFADFEAARIFIAHVQRESRIKPPSFFHVTATDRSLYAVLDIIGRVFLTVTPFEFHLKGRSAQFIIVEGIVAGVPATFHIQVGADVSQLPDGSQRYLVDHRIAAGFPSGIITLLSMNGPVVWNANLNSVKEPTKPLVAVLHPDSGLTIESLTLRRVAANLRAVEALNKNIHERVLPEEQEPRYLFELSRAWECLGSSL